VSPDSPLAAGETLNFVNAMDIAKDGTIYFSASQVPYRGEGRGGSGRTEGGGEGQGGSGKGVRRMRIGMWGKG
jgi:hypothetical protein